LLVVVIEEEEEEEEEEVVEYPIIHPHIDMDIILTSSHYRG
jgi:hypothetical protein